MRAITAVDRAAGVGGLSLTELPYPHAAENDGIVQVHAAGFTALVRPGGTLVTIPAPPTIHPTGGRAVFFVVEPDRDQLIQLAARLREGRLVPVVATVRPLAEAPEAFTERGRTILTGIAQ